MKYYLIAGERSGDLHAGNLAKEIFKLDPSADLRGIGGEFMSSAGVKLSVHYGELAFMGFIEVVRNYSTIARYTKRCKQEIEAFAPDVVILVDYGGFNMRIAAFARKYNFRVFYYITPKVWAWYQNRALRLKRTVDRMFVILPFEKEFFARYDWPVDYVGNPVWDAVRAHVADPRFLENNHIDQQKPLVALLPGSRKQELVRMVPIMARVAARFPDVTFAVAIVNNLDRRLYADLENLPNVKAIVEDTYNLLLHARAAIVTSGTATLETALFKVPQAVIYRAGASTYWVVKLMIRVPFISLVNLIAGRLVVQELIQENANDQTISEELTRLLRDDLYRKRILDDYDSVIRMLGEGSASANAARLMIGYLEKDGAE